MNVRDGVSEGVSQSAFLNPLLRVSREGVIVIIYVCFFSSSFCLGAKMGTQRIELKFCT